jgi:hypothetical protein
VSLLLRFQGMCEKKTPHYPDDVCNSSCNTDYEFVDPDIVSRHLNVVKLLLITLHCAKRSIVAKTLQRIFFNDFRDLKQKSCQKSGHMENNTYLWSVSFVFCK